MSLRSASRTPRRLRPLLVAIALTAGLTSGCSSGEPAPSASETPAEATSTTESPSETPTAEGPSEGSPRPTATSTTSEGSDTPTVTATTGSSTVPPTASVDERLRTHLLSSLTAELGPDAPLAAMSDIEVIAVPLEDADRDLWVAVTSGSGIWELGEDSAHVAAVYELRADETWVEVAHRRLESAPTFADIEIIATEQADAAWIAIHGATGAHAGTFELLRFDGVQLLGQWWWFSSSPNAGRVEDLDGDGLREVVLNNSDPYVYCYACGVVEWDELIYRWMDGDLVEVAIDAVASDSPGVAELTEQAALAAGADLWVRADLLAQLAVGEAPDDPEVQWLALAINRVARLRLEQAGAEQQPLLTSVLAGEYEDAVDLMRPYVPEAVFAADGPLISGTVAEDEWAETTGDYLVQYATRAIEFDPDLDAAYAVRAVGTLFLDPTNIEDALADVRAAAALAPADDFYQLAVAYLGEQAAGG